MFGFIGTVLRFIWALLRDVLIVPLVDLYEWCRRFIADVAFPFILSKIPESVKEVFSDLNIDLFESLIYDVAWILPVWTILTMYALIYAACGAVRIIRWILAFIPTIGG